ncbi:MAG: hypothetical protein GXZ02_05260 [Clostridiales bacterium]|nr:hypothetical protein [Clostridiales bacterium]
MLNIYLNQWNKASLVCNQLNEEDRLEYKVADAIINFIKSRLGLKRKRA